jgi:hypothetical protein
MVYTLNRHVSFRAKRGQHSTPKVSSAPVMNGVERLSLTGRGKDSVNMPITAAAKARNGWRKTVAPKKAAANPAMEPSRFFVLL